MRFELVALIHFWIPFENSPLLQSTTGCRCGLFFALKRNNVAQKV